MLEAILLLGLLALLASHRALTKRVTGLEEQVAALSAENVREFVETPIAVESPASFFAPESVAAPEILAERRAEPLEESHPPAANTVSERESAATLFERLVGGRLLIWTGGVAVALAGLFLVRYSIELGLIGPRARMIAAALFGLALLGGGEWARRRLPGDPRVGQALVGAGVLILYAAAYGSHTLYGLIGLSTAFVLMAAVAAAALALSLRHGTPTAALGLVGGFATPLLLGDANAGAVPLLGYLALLNLDVFAVAARSGRTWLTRAAQAATLLWTGSLLLQSPEIAWLPTGMFLLVYAVAASIAADGRDEPWPSAAPTVALLQLAWIVAASNHDPRAWAMLLALAAAGFALGLRHRSLDAVADRALLPAMLLLATNDRADAWLWAAAATLLFAGGAWLRLRAENALRHSLLFCAAAAAPALTLLAANPALLPRAGWGLLLAALAAGPCAMAWRLRDLASEDGPWNWALLAPIATAAALLAGAAAELFSPDWLPLAFLLIALLVAGAGDRLRDGGVLRIAIVAGSIGAVTAATRVPELWNVLAASLAGTPALAAGLPSPARGLLLFAAPAALWLAVWRLVPAREEGLARFAFAAAALLTGAAAYLAYKRVFAIDTLADFTARGFAERTLLTQALFLAGWLLISRPHWLTRPAAALTMIAAARFLWFDLLLLNPAWVPQNGGATPLINLIPPAYLGSAFWLHHARRRAGTSPAASAWLALFLLALLAGAGLIVRQLFQGAILTGTAVPRAEFYGYSLAGLLLSVALLLWGWRRGDRPIRVAGLAVLTATIVKVFAVDAAALTGVLRILSFAGLGAALIGMGKLYGTILGRTPKPAG